MRNPVLKLLSFLLTAVLLLSITPSARAVDTSEDDKKTVLVIATHCDDEINVGAAIIKANLDAGNEVYVSDISVNGIRGPETLAALALLGLPEDHFIISGCGMWGLNTGELYDNDHDAPYAEEGYRRNTTFSWDNGPSWAREYLADAELTSSYNSAVYIYTDIIDTLRPDEIYCVDQDDHVGHRTTSYIIEDAICALLRQGSGYTPRVFKGFAYGTAWDTVADFYAPSPDDSSRSYLLPTVQPYGMSDEYVLDDSYYTVYRWADRVRFPVPAGLDSATDDNLIFDLYRCFASQLDEENAYLRGQKSANGDKVFWERDTRSLSYTAAVTVSSNEEAAGRINDFRLTDRLDNDGNGNIAGVYNNYSWRPDKYDSEKTVTLSWDAASDIKSVRLYDDLKTGAQIKGGKLTLSLNGKVVYTRLVGALEDGGAATELTFPTTITADTLSFTITRGVGSYGLSELEVYTEEDSSASEPDFIQIYLADSKTQDFVYDYPVALNGSAYTLSLAVYRYPDETESAGYRWEVVDDVNGYIKVDANGLVTLSPNTPTGLFELRVTDLATGLSDTMRLDVLNYSLPDTVTTEVGKGGSVTVKPDGSVYITPDTGYKIASVKVNGGERGAVAELHGLTPPDKVTVCFHRASVSTLGRFDDVHAGDWYAEAVDYVVNEGIFAGISTSHFGANATMTRQMFWTVLARIDGAEVSGAGVYEAARQWIVENGLSDGSDPSGALSREQLVSTLYRFAKSRGYDVSATASLAAFTDAAGLVPYAAEAFAWALGAGVVSGVSATSLSPEGTATRAQLAAILMRFLVASF